VSRPSLEEPATAASTPGQQGEAAPCRAPIAASCKTNGNQRELQPMVHHAASIRPSPPDPVYFWGIQVYRLLFLQASAKVNPFMEESLAAWIPQLPEQSLRREPFSRLILCSTAFELLADS